MQVYATCFCFVSISLLSKKTCLCNIPGADNRTYFSLEGLPVLLSHGNTGYQQDVILGLHLSGATPSNGLELTTSPRVLGTIVDIFVS